MMDDKIRCVSFCGHCGHDSLQSLIKIHVNNEGRYGELFTFAKCETCGRPLIYHDRWGHLGKKAQEIGAFHGRLNPSAMIFPKQRKLPDSVPPKIAKLYQEALNVKRVSGTGFASFIRRCLETVCNEQNCKGKNLAEMVDDLADRHIIPRALSDMTDLIRIIGNAASHDSIDIDATFADAIDGFFEAVLNVVYVQPANAKDIKVKFDIAKKKAGK